MSKYIDDMGWHWGYCNSCGDEAVLDQECPNGCEDGEVVTYDDDMEDS